MNAWSSAAKSGESPRHQAADRILTAEHPRVIEQIQEYRLALVRGERPARDALLQQFPDISGELADCLDALEFMHSVAPQLGEAVLDNLRNTPVAPPSLGDFRIVRELGRGGMGVVYEAEQLSLSRKVALKVLPFAAVLDARQLQRFKNEAQAAASLHHTHIVPVYSVGCDRGVHYYAMQYIDGQTLAEIITALRETRAHHPAPSPAPGSEASAASSASIAETLARFGGTTAPFPADPARFRSAARMMIEVAEALDYAHQQGVVHRDIKPLNLMIDVHGKPWIADFGLAHVESNTQLTFSGDMLGTLRYMSPEQVSFKRAAIDHRTDIYSFGATIYELLTLEPAFSGTTRQELLRQIAIDEPQRLRRVEPEVPVELEIITLKAMAKDPAARYASGQELADDLRRYLLDQPILARRPTLADRAAKWSRRHRAAITVAGACLVLTLMLAIAGLAVSNALISREQERTAQALAAAKAGQAAAAEGRARADANLREALAAIDRMLTRASDEQPAATPQAELLRRRMLIEALEFYETFLRQPAADLRLRLEMARTYRKVGAIHSQLGELAAAEAAWHRSLKSYEALAAEHPENPEHQFGVGEVSADLCVLLWEIPHRYHDAELLHHQSLEALQWLVNRYPQEAKYRSRLAHAHHDWGYFLRGVDRLSEAEQAFRQALAQVRERRDRLLDDLVARRDEAKFLNSLGLVLRQSGRPQEAEDSHRLALSILDGDHRLVDEEHGNQLARTLGHLALAVEHSGRRHEAEPLLRQALALRRQPLDGSPASALQRSEAALTCAALAGLLLRDDRGHEAEPLYREAAETAEQLASDFPAVPKHRNDLALILEKYARVLLAQRRPREAAVILSRALDLRQELTALSPGAADCRRNLTYCQLLSALASWRLGERERARECYQRASESMSAQNNSRQDVELSDLWREVSQTMAPDENESSQH